MRFNLRLSVKFCFPVILALPLLGCSSENVQSGGEAAANSDSDAIPDGERISVTEAEIKDARQKDDEKRFLGKQLELKGVVGALSADGGGSMILDEVFLSILDREPWAKVLPGQEVTLLGAYTEKRGLKFTIESVTGDRTIAEAPDLAKEFITDKVATNAKYKDQYLELHGTVAETKIGDGDIIMMRLKSDGENAVMCNFYPSGQAEKVKAVKVGDKIKLVGSYTPQTTLADESPILNDCLLITE